MMNRRGAAGEKLMFVVLFAVMFIIGFGIALGVLMFFGSEIEYRGVEAQMLNYHVRECILRNSLGENPGDNFYSICLLDKMALERNNLIKICKNIPAGDSDSGCVRSSNALFAMPGDYQPCKITGGNAEYPYCSYSRIYKGEDSYDLITISSQRILLR